MVSTSSPQEVSVGLHLRLPSVQIIRSHVADFATLRNVQTFDMNSFDDGIGQVLSIPHSLRSKVGLREAKRLA